MKSLTLRPTQEVIETGRNSDEEPMMATNMVPTLIGHLAAPNQEGVNVEKMTAVLISKQSTKAQRRSSMTMNSAITDPCGQFGKMNHTDKMLADQCRLMTAILGEGWGRLSSKPMDMFKVAKKPMAKHDVDRNDDPDEDTSAEVTEETGEINSKDVRTALRPTNPNRNTAATELKLNSNSTRGPTQDLLQDKTSTKSWHKKTNTGLAKEVDKPNDDKEATEKDTARKDVISGAPDHDSPTADEGAVTTTIGEVDKPSDEPLTITSEFKEPPTRPHIIDVGDADTSEEESDEPDNEPAQVTTMPEEWFEVDDALSVPPRASEEGRGTALTEEDAPILPCERLHRSRYIVKVCGWATHGI